MTDLTDKPELLPLSCPFCGEAASLTETVGDFGDDNTYAIVCWDCEAQSAEMPSASQAIRAWNRREK